MTRNVALLVHLFFSEWQWRLLLQGQGGFEEEPDVAEYPTVESIQQRWQPEEQQMWAYLDSLSDSDLTGIICYPVDDDIIREHVLWHCLYHVVNHGMQHRSEAAHLLTLYGQSPDDIDFTMFLNERGA